MTKQKGRSIALGAFDGVHLGHQAVIRAAVEGAGGTLIPEVFTFDEAERLPKQGERDGWILTPALKREALCALGVQSVVERPFHEFKSMPPEAFVRDYLIGERAAKRIACGEDYRFGKDAAGDVFLLRRICEEKGVSLVTVPPVLRNGERISATRIRAWLQAGGIQEANECLGRAYGYDFAVAQGRQVGRRLLLPTVNQEFPPSYCVPRYGVYAARAAVDGLVYNAVANIGVRPTFGGGAPLSETHILRFSKQVSATRIHVTLHAFLREERRFASIDALRAQIEADRAKAERYFA